MTSERALQFVEHHFSDGAALAAALAQSVADQLRAAIAAHATALLAVSGGTTPARFLTELSTQSLGWDRVTVTLADERWVPSDHPRSNEHVLRENLLRHEAAEARFVPLYHEAPSPEAALAQVEAELAALVLPFDAVVLGMGTDGHCASLFPGGDNLAAALGRKSAARVMPMRAPGAGEPRMTLTLAAILASRALYLHFEGAEKRAAFERAIADGAGVDEFPVRAVLRDARAPVQVFWCA